MTRIAATAMVLATLAGAGCGDGDSLRGDQYPILADRSSGAFVVGVQTADGAVRVGVVDLLSPISVVDPGIGIAPRRLDQTVTVLGQRGVDDDSLVPRARLPVSTFEIHPCDTAVCSVGSESEPREFDAILGADALTNNSPRFDFAANSITLFPNIAGDDASRTKQCDAVFDAPFRGGGTLLIGGAEIAFSGRRVTVAACLEPKPEVLLAPSARGTNLLLVQSTAIGPSIIGASAYARYRDVAATTPPLLADLPTASLYLSSGLVTGHHVTISAMSLAGTLGSDPRGACGDIYASYYLVAGDCPSTDSDNCPCVKNQTCGAPSVVELTPTAGIEFVVLADDDPTLQSLRAELRPDVAEIDGILGTDALVGLEQDVDFPNNRLLFRCTSGEGCAIRPQLPKTNTRDEVAACLAQ